MLTCVIHFNSILEAHQFHQRISHFPCNVMLRCGDACVDAKSMLGIFSLDLSKPLTLEIDSNDTRLLHLLEPQADSDR